MSERTEGEKIARKLLKSVYVFKLGYEHLLKKELTRIFQEAKENGRNILYDKHGKTAKGSYVIEIQSAWFIGFADCWNYLHKKMLGDEIE